MPNFDDILLQYGLRYTVERESQIIQQNVLGLPNTEKSSGKKYIGFRPNSDIKAGDCLINPSGERVYVIDLLTHFVFQQPYQLKAYYQTEYAKRSSNQTSTIFNIQNATGSVIGTQSVVNMNYNDSLATIKEQIKLSNSNDKEELTQIINLLEMIVNNQVPAQKGILSKFSAVLERNSWITGSIASALLGWLTSQVPPIIP